MVENSPPKILIVDDQKNNLFLLENMLSSLEVKIYTTTSPYEAIELINNEEFALVISDVQMPGMNGFQMLQKIREREENQYIPVIFISAIYTQDEHILKGIKTGAIDFIAKPFNHEILIGKIEALLQIYIQRKKLESLLLLFNNLYKELSEKNKIIEKITDHTNDAIFLLNENLNIVFYNNKVLSLFKLTEKNLKNESFALNNLFLNKDFFDIILSSKKNELEKEIAITIETECKTYNNEIFQAETTISCFHVDNNLHYLLLIKDITERKLNEKRLLKAKEIKETNKVMAEFIDKINHELNTPINSIKGILKNLLQNKKISESQNSEIILSLQLAFDQIKNLENFIKNILQFKDKYIITKKEIKLSNIIENIKEFCDELKSNNKFLNINLELNNDVSNLILFTNENKLLYTILNIIEFLTCINSDSNATINICFSSESENFIIKFNLNNINKKVLQQYFEDNKNYINVISESSKNILPTIKQYVEALKGELFFDENNNVLIFKLPIE